MGKDSALMFFRISLILFFMTIAMIFIVDPATPEFVITIISMSVSGLLAIASLLYATWRGKHEDHEK